MASVYGTILDAVKALVEAMTGLTTSGQVVVRKRLAFVKGTDTTFPFVCIAPTVERLDDSHMSNTDHIDYPVQVAVVRQSALSLIDYETTLLLREQIRQKLRRPTLSGAAGVYHCVAYDPSPAFDMQGFDAALDVSVQEFVWRATETRTQ